MIALRTEDWIGSSKGGREVVGGWSEDGDVTGGSWMVERRTFAVDKTTEGPCCFFLSASSSLFITLALTHSCMHVCFTFYFLLFPSPTYSRQKSIGLFSLSPTTAFMTVMTYIDTRCFRPYASISLPLFLSSESAGHFPSFSLSCRCRGGGGFVLVGFLLLFRASNGAVF